MVSSWLCFLASADAIGPDHTPYGGVINRTVPGKLIQPPRLLFPNNTVVLDELLHEEPTSPVVEAITNDSGFSLAAIATVCAAQLTIASRP